MLKINFLLYALIFSTLLQAQKKTSDAMLHSSQSQYPILYEAMPGEQIKGILDKVFNYIDAVTPAEMINKKTNQPVEDVAKADSNTVLQQGDFRITSYEWALLILHFYPQQI